MKTLVLLKNVMVWGLEVPTLLLRSLVIALVALYFDASWVQLELGPSRHQDLDSIL
jgi:hypothetical protein